jgi:hypothetical protein
VYRESRLKEQRELATNSISKASDIVCGKVAELSCSFAGKRGVDSMAELRWVGGGPEDDVRMIVRGIRWRSLHGRKIRHGATWTLVLEATDELGAGLYSGCGATLSWRPS